MNRREVLAGIAASGLMASSSPAQNVMPNTYLELKTWRLHNSAEDQGTRVAGFLQNGLSPALSRSGAKLIGAFANVIGQDGPYYVTLAQYPSMAAIQGALSKLDTDEAYQSEVQKLSAGPGLPFVRFDSSILRSFDVLPQPVTSDASEKGAPRIFELRTYESQSLATLKRKVGMFNNAEAKIFERLGMRPVFFGETLIGPKQPNLMYMLSFDDLAARERLWGEFGRDPEWHKLSSQPELKDSQIVANISNVILRPLSFSLIR
ncbi:MAG: NIPSNAP family protein [Acidobacteriota bacterium]|nr:NIPSNAP family protein [Acidobacteriota bacterium]